MSQLWRGGFCFGGRRGPVSFRAVKGKGGQSALELLRGASQLPGAVKGNDLSQLWSWWWCCCRFLFWGGASQLPGCEVSQLWSLVLLSVFVLGGAGGQSASGL